MALLVYSSSTSFGIYGVYVEDTKKLLDRLSKPFEPTKTEGCEHKFNRNKAKFCPECGAKSWEIQEDDRDCNDELEELLDAKGLDVIMWGGGESCSEGMYVGKNLDGNTVNESKDPLNVLKEAEPKIKELFPKSKIQFYSDSGYNG